MSLFTPKISTKKDQPVIKPNPPQPPSGIISDAQAQKKREEQQKTAVAVKSNDQMIKDHYRQKAGLGDIPESSWTAQEKAKQGQGRKEEKGVLTAKETKKEQTLTAEEQMNIINADISKYRDPKEFIATIPKFVLSDLEQKKQAEITKLENNKKQKEQIEKLTEEVEALQSENEVYNTVDRKKQQKQQKSASSSKSNTMLYTGIGVVAIVVVIAFVYFMKRK